MDISNLMEEDLHPEARQLLDELRERFVLDDRELGLAIAMQHHLVCTSYYPRDLPIPEIEHHKTRAYQIALAQCQLLKIIRGEDS